jgi:hypothetical protein
MTKHLTVPCNPHRIAEIIARPGTKILWFRRYEHTKALVGQAGVGSREIIEELTWHQEHRVLEITVQGEPC